MTVSYKLNVVAVVVTYQPERAQVDLLLEILSSQVNSIIVIDNGSSRWPDVDQMKREYETVQFVKLDGNYGIAYAQNVGIGWARSNEAKYVLLMDQDSIPDGHMVSNLLHAMDVLVKSERLTACVGPFYADQRHQNSSPFVRLEKYKFRRIPCQGVDNIIPVDFVIASGCLIPMAVLDAVGEMRTDFFIDYVDIEWGVRARSSGYLSYGVCAATMLHNLGETPIHALGRVLPSHNPLRGYYRFRNALYLLLLPKTSMSWRVAEIRRLVLQLIFFSLFSDQKVTHFNMMCLGIWHGFIGKLGKYRGAST